MSSWENRFIEAKRVGGNISREMKEEIISEHTPLIRYIVSRIAVRLPSHIDLEKIFETGVEGLLYAIENFSPERNCRFKTYAEFRIKGAILDHLRSQDWVPRSVRKKGRKLGRSYEEIERKLNYVDDGGRDDDTESVEARCVIADVVASLPQKERLVLSLHYYEDFSMKEIAEILGVVGSRAREIHTKAVLRLRSRLDEVPIESPE
jgi:RNA polymerase sigma factor FliA